MQIIQIFKFYLIFTSDFRKINKLKINKELRELSAMIFETGEAYLLAIILTIISICLFLKFAYPKIVIYLNEEEKKIN